MQVSFLAIIFACLFRLQTVSAGTYFLFLFSAAAVFLYIRLRISLYFLISETFHKSK